jgi:Fe-S oxidoreductase
MKCSRCKAHCTVRVREPDMWYDLCRYKNQKLTADLVIGCTVRQQTINKWIKEQESKE